MKSNITLGLFSVSKVENPAILESEDTVKLLNTLKETYNINIKFPPNLFLNIEGTSPKIRAEQIHNLFLDESIDILWALTGGSASNEILEYLNFDLIQKSNKSIIGYSDVTILLNALYTKTKRINFLGPNFKTLITQHPGTQQSIDLLSYALRSTKGELKSFSSIYDKSIKDNLNNVGIKILQPGKAEGIGIGGNLSSIVLLIDTPFFPSLQDKILLIEECHEFSIGIIRRNLFRLRQAQGFKKLRGIIFGHINKKCYKDYTYTLDKTLKDVFGDLKIPLVTQAGHGHILPMQTLPIGGNYIIDTDLPTPIIRYHLIKDTYK